MHCHEYAACLRSMFDPCPRFSTSLVLLAIAVPVTMFVPDVALCLPLVEQLAEHSLLQGACISTDVASHILPSAKSLRRPLQLHSPCYSSHHPSILSQIHAISTASLRAAVVVMSSAVVMLSTSIQSALCLPALPKSAISISMSCLIIIILLLFSRR